ncbi:MAG: CusA/CzcA family heavy metal efflux RND transporter, partial [Bryobacterales bacterium]|nr:CusA/CzcA family heavy metal efflux RND transporter [Bryobacterales bacterium]
MVDGVVESAVRNRLIVVVMALMLLAAGVQAVRSLSVDAFPDVTTIQVQIATEAPGRSPEEVERFVTVPIGIGMTGLPGMNEMRTLVKPGLSIVTLIFDDNVDVYFARQMVMERLAEVRSRLPEGVNPILGPVSTALGEVYQYTLERPDDGERALTKSELVERRIIQDWVVRPMLRSTPGVAEINSVGGFVRQYQVLADPLKLRAYSVTLQDLTNALARNNSNAGGGLLPQNAEQYLVRGVGLIQSLDDIRGIVLKEVAGTPVYVRDIGDVRLGEEVRYGAVVKGGYTEAVGGVVIMIASGNAKEIVSRVKDRVEDINQRGLLPNGLQIVPFYDRSQLVDAALWTVSKVLLEGIVLVTVVLFLFLGDLRSSVIVIATLILTPLATFMVMNQVGLSANLMSLGGLAIAIGLMVDGSVVVVENVFAKLSHGSRRPKHEVVLEAVREVGTPVIFGITVIILVFLPLMTLEGMEGKMFAPLAYTIAIALAISLVLSLTLSPVLSQYLLKGGSEDDTFLVRWLRKPFDLVLTLALRNEKTAILLAVASFGGAVALFPLLGTSFIPEMKEGSISPNIDRVPNISLDEAIQMEMRALKLVADVPGVTRVVSRMGRGESPSDPAGQNEADVVATLAPLEERDGRTQDQIADEIRDKLKVIPGVNLVMAQPISDRVDEMVTGVRADVAVKIFGDDLEILVRKAAEVAQVAGKIRGMRDTRVDRVGGQQYLTITINRQAIARLGLNAADIHDVIETAVGGKAATEIFEGERRFQAVVRYPGELRDSVEDIRNILLETPNRAKVMLHTVADIRVVEGPAQINRDMAKRRIVVGVNIQDRDLGGFVAELQQRVDEELELPPGYSIEWGGQFQNMERARKHLMIIVPITIGAIFFLLFLLFHSVRFAALIILVLPFASIGGVVALYVTGEYLSVPASVGFIALWGIAVLNGVVLVSYIRKLRESGYPQREAVLEGTRLRFR